ncbi:arrestin: lateral eye-like protein, partial [Dinothrombium tinctorium]
TLNARSTLTLCNGCISTVSTARNNSSASKLSRTIPENLLQESAQSTASTGKIEKISKAMKAYLEKAKEHDDFIKERQKEFEFGKRHLCNIMGWDHNNITQKDIDLAIEYLIPSGLFDLRARPQMKPPEDIYLKKKVAEFDVFGKPHHSLFYTKKPNYYQLLHDVFATYMNLCKFEDEMIRQGVINPSPESQASLYDSMWLNKDELKNMILEKISDEEYDYAISSLETIANHPYSANAKNFLMKYRKELVSVTSQMEVPPLTYTEDGRSYAIGEGYRKHCVAQVTVWSNGKGSFIVNGKDILYFSHFKEREQLMFPLQFTGLLFKVDVEATVTGNGIAAQAGAIRHGLSLALRSFVEPSVVEDMRLAGLLTKDRRKSAPNGKLTVYLGKRDFGDYQTHCEPVEGPGPEDNGPPLGVEYELKLFIANSEQEKPSRRNSVSMAIRKLLYTTPSPTLRQPSAIVSKGFMLSAGKLNLEVTLDREIYFHGDKISAHVTVSNYSKKNVRNIKVSVVQHTEVTLVNGHYSKTVASIESREGCPITPGASFSKVFQLLPLAAQNRDRRGIALDGMLKEADTNLASSTPGSSADAIGIVISYVVRVRLYLGAIGGDLSADVPFKLANPVEQQAKEKSAPDNKESEKMDGDKRLKKQLTREMSTDLIFEDFARRRQESEDLE